MTKTPNPEKTTPPADHAISGPAAAPPGTHDEPVGETSLHTKDRLARNAEADPADPADRKRGMPELQASRLSPPVLVLVAGALALIVVLVIFGGLV